MGEWLLMVVIRPSEGWLHALILSLYLEVYIGSPLRLIVHLGALLIVIE